MNQYPYHFAEPGVVVTLRGYFSADTPSDSPDVEVTRTLAVDLTAPSVSYTPPATSTVGEAISISPSTADTDIASYSATGLPPGLRIDRTTGVIRGTPNTANAGTTSFTVTVTDTAGNPADVHRPPSLSPRCSSVVPLNVDAIAGDDTVNLAETGEAGFTISGDTGSEGGGVGDGEGDHRRSSPRARRRPP